MKTIAHTTILPEWYRVDETTNARRCRAARYKRTKVLLRMGEVLDGIPEPGQGQPEERGQGENAGHTSPLIDWVADADLAIIKEAAVLLLAHLVQEFAVGDCPMRELLVVQGLIITRLKGQT